MEPGSESLPERVARLEAQVAWLLQRAQAPAQPPARPTVIPPRPVPRPSPGRTISPVVWIAGIAGALFLLGAVFFFTWAIQRGWIGPSVRFLLGLATGGAISAYAARLLPGEGRKLGVALLLAGLGTLQFTFRAGAMDYHFFTPVLGLLATAAITLLAGGLAARAASGGALTVSLVAGLAAPLMFSQGGHHEVALATYLAVLQGAALAVPYLAQVGEAWHGPRWVGFLGTWFLLFICCSAVGQGDAAALAGLVLLHLVLAGLAAWLPGRAAPPGTPTALWLLTSMLGTAYGWLLWQHLGLAEEAFALPVLAMAALNLALVAPLRRRLDSPRADGALLALAVGHLALAVPVALAWRWVGPLWGAFAVGLAWVSLKAEEGPYAGEATILRWLAGGLALATTLRWLVHGSDLLVLHPTAVTPLLNGAAAEGALAAAAWYLLTRRGGPLGLVAFLGLEVTANLTLALEAARLVQHLTGVPGTFRFTRAASVTLTLVWALSGAWQWMRGLRQREEAGLALRLAGYAWMGVASLKLLAVDLDHADTPMKALAFLGVGAIGMAAAILAHRARQAQP